MASGDTSLVAGQLLSAVRQKRDGAAIIDCQTPCPELHMGLGLAPGARVLDLVTGQEGVILAGTVTHSIIPTSGTASGEGSPGAVG